MDSDKLSAITVTSPAETQVTVGTGTQNFT